MAFGLLGSKMGLGAGGLIGKLLDRKSDKKPGAGAVAGAGARLMARDPVVPQHNPLAL